MKPSLPHSFERRRQKRLAKLHAELAEGRPVFTGKRVAGGTADYALRVRYFRRKSPERSGPAAACLPTYLP